MDPTLIPQIINVLLVIGGITAGGVTLEHLLENYVMGWLPQQYKAAAPAVFGYIGTVLVRMATGTPFGMAISGLGALVLPFIMAGISQAVHGTSIGASVNVSTPPPPSATPPPPPDVKAAASALLIGFLLLASTAKAGTMELGVPLSPTAGASYVEETWITMPTLFDITRQGDFTWSATFYVGAQTTWQWGPNYGLGVTLGGNVIGTGTIAGVNGVPVAGHVCGGLVGNFQTVEVGLLYDDKGLHCGISKSW